MSSHPHHTPLRRAALLPLILLLTLLGAACGGGNSGFPKDAGEYPIQPNSISYDGKKYALIWQDPSGGLHPAEGRDVQMARDDRTFLQNGSGSPVIHLKDDEAVVVKGRDRDGDFTSSWFPFFLGYGLGNLGGGGLNQPYPGDTYGRGPSYQYPPSDSFGRGDQLNGSVQRSKPDPPDYTRVQPAPYAVSGQSSGTGGGTAATNKSTAPSSGQSGGTGSGSAATNKGTFSSGSSGTSSGPGTGVGGGSGWSSGSKPSTGTGSSGSSAPSRPPVSGGSKKR